MHINNINKGILRHSPVFVWRYEILTGHIKSVTSQAPFYSLTSTLLNVQQNDYYSETKKIDFATKGEIMHVIKLILKSA